MPQYVKVSDIIAQLHVDSELWHFLETEELIHPKRSSEGELVLSSADADRVRVALLLAGELDVNWPGVEVIIHMRDSMLAMQRQFAEILDALVEEMRRRVRT
ncbi:MAG: chaperone modulator CbpM [Candidatus Binatia bacterium]